MAHVVHAKDIIGEAADGSGGRIVAGPGGLGGIWVREAEYLQGLKQSRQRDLESGKLTVQVIGFFVRIIDFAFRRLLGRGSTEGVGGEEVFGKEGRA